MRILASQEPRALIVRAIRDSFRWGDLREVGIVFGLEILRLARNSLDWYQLLELVVTFDVLIANEDGV